MAEGRDEKGRFTEKNLWAYIPKDVGRPRKYNTPEELIEKAKEFFEWSDQTRKGKYSEAGFRVWMAMTKYDFFHYRKDPNFATAMEYIDAQFEDEAEIKLMWAGSFQGAKFKLMNKHGWKEEINQNQNVTFTEVKPEVINNNTPKLEETE